MFPFFRFKIEGGIKTEPTGELNHKELNQVNPGNI